VDRFDLSPPEGGTVYPHTMEYHREPARHSDLGSLETAALGHLCASAHADAWVGAKKRLPSRTKKLRDEKIDRTLGAPP
jgi:hypothetical protein